WGAVNETGGHGYVTAFDVDGWSVADEWSPTQSGSGAGIWMAGQGLTENDGHLFLMTGNGDFDGKDEFGESFVHLRFSGSKFSVIDWWTPFMDSMRSAGGWEDMDLGSGAPIYLPAP